MTFNSCTETWKMKKQYTQVVYSVCDIILLMCLKYFVSKHAQPTGSISVINLEYKERQIVPRCGKEISLLISYNKILDLIGYRQARFEYYLNSLRVILGYEQESFKRSGTSRLHSDGLGRVNFLMQLKTFSHVLFTKIEIKLSGFFQYQS